MTTQEEFFDSLIEYIDAAINEKVGCSYYPEHDVEKKEWCKRDLKESYQNLLKLYFMDDKL